MEISTHKLASKQKEACAVITMRTMVEKLAQRDSLGYDEALFHFADSPIYNALFDFETSIWMEGPEYLLSLYDGYIQTKVLPV